jgi:hypothetical protein
MPRILLLSSVIAGSSRIMALSPTDLILIVLSFDRLGLRTNDFKRLYPRWETSRGAQRNDLDMVLCRLRAVMRLGTSFFSVRAERRGSLRHSRPTSRHEK